MLQCNAVGRHLHVLNSIAGRVFICTRGRQVPRFYARNHAPHFPNDKLIFFFLVGEGRSKRTRSLDKRRRKAHTTVVLEVALHLWRSNAEQETLNPKMWRPIRVPARSIRMECCPVQLNKSCTCWVQHHHISSFSCHGVNKQKKRKRRQRNGRGHRACLVS
jgi:hypothetical protein